jgi:hypothetical protein
MVRGLSPSLVVSGQSHFRGTPPRQRMCMIGDYKLQFNLWSTLDRVYHYHRTCTIAESHRVSGLCLIGDCKYEARYLDVSRSDDAEYDESRYQTSIITAGN